MFKLIKNNRIVTDEWRTLKVAQGDTPHNVRLPVGPLLVPLSVWQARRTELIHREYEHGWPLGIWLAAGEDAAESIADDIDDFTVIAIVFNQYSANQAYGTARRLREHYGYNSELRAIVQKDDSSRLQEAGFDARIAIDYSEATTGSVPADFFNLIRQVKSVPFSNVVIA